MGPISHCFKALDLLIDGNLSQWHVMDHVYLVAEDTYNLYLAFNLQRAKLLEKTKAEGNKLFKENRFSEAYEYYSKALSIDLLNDVVNAKLYFNRATASFKVKNDRTIFGASSRTFKFIAIHSEIFF